MLCHADATGLKLDEITASGHTPSLPTDFAACDPYDPFAIGAFRGIGIHLDDGMQRQWYRRIDTERMSNRIPIRIDQIDRRILRALQRDGRLQNVELAKQVGLSPSPCLRRVRRLEQTGVIDRYVAVIDAAKVGIGLEVFARVRLVTQDAETVERFSRAMRSLPQVVECHIMAGECDALLRVVAADIDDYRNFQSTHLTRNNAVESVKTDIPLQKVKLVSELPI